MNKIDRFIEILVFAIALVAVLANMSLEQKVNELENENNKLKVEVMSYEK